MDPSSSFLEFGKPGKTLSPTERHKAAQLTEGLKAFLHDQAASFVVESGVLPILRSYSSDCTPIKAKKRIVASAGETRVVRVGGSGQEYLLQAGFLQYQDAQGDWKTVVVLRDPVLMSTGKDHLKLFAAGRAFLPMLRELGHRGLVVEHMVFDRAAFSALNRIFRQQHTAIHADLPPDVPGAESPALLSLLCWVVGTGCCSHDAHNALHWALHQDTPDISVHKDLHIVVESLRNGYSDLHQHLGQWLLAVVLFQESPLPSDIAHQLWTALGLEASLVEELLSLGLLWHEGRLLVACEFQEDPEVWDKLSVSLLQVMRFEKYSDSRWLSMGSSMRSLCASLLLGLEVLVQHVRLQPHVSDFYLGGSKRLTCRNKRYAVLASLCSYLPDAFLMEVLEDSRVPMHLEELSHAVLEEFDFLKALPMQVWDLLGGLAEQPGVSLRSDVLQATHVAHAYLDTKVLQVAKSLPWSMCTGDLEANLQWLAEQPEPDEPTSKKMHRLLQMLQQSSAAGRFATSPAVSLEHQSGGTAAATSAIHKAHPHVLWQRAFLHQVQPLFFVA